MFIAILLFVALQNPKYYLQKKMAVPNRGTGSCDQAVSALEAALEVCALPFYVYGVPNSCLKLCTEYLYIQTLLTYVSQAGLLWRKSSYSSNIYHVHQVCCMCTAYYLCQYSPL